MTVAMASLRVSAEFDSTGYKAGMDQKIAADERGTASSTQLGAAMAKADVAAGLSGGAMGRLSKTYIDGYGTSAKFYGELAKIQKEMEVGGYTAEKTALAYTGLAQKLGMTASAAELAARGNAEFAAVVGRVNTTLDTSAGAFGRAAAGLRGFSGMLGVTGESLKSMAEGFGIGFGLSELMRLPKEIGDLVRESAGLGHVAEVVGITTKQLQELQFAGRGVHITTETMNSALERFSKNLGIASQGGGELHRILELNHVAISGNLMKDFLSVANLAEHATNAEARNVVVTSAFGKNAEEMGLLFEKGAAGIKAASDEADRLGAVIAGTDLQRIKEIDKQYNDFATTLSTRFKAGVVGAVLVLDDLMKANQNISNSLTDLYQNPSWSTYLRFLAGDYAGAVGAALGAPINQVNRATKGDRAPVIRGGMGGRFEDDFGATKLPTAANDAAVKEAERLRKQFDEGLKAADKQTAALRAQVGAFGMSAGAAAEYEKRLELLNLATENHVKLSESDRLHIDQVAAATGRATTELERMKDAQQAQAFMAQSLFETMKSAIQGTDSWSASLSKLASSLADAALQAALLGSGPLAGIFGTKSDSGGPLGAIVGGLLHLGGGGPTGAQIFNATGFHGGGVVGFGGTPRYVHPSYFDNAPRLHGGLKSDEFPAILQRGERVVPRGQGAGGSSGGGNSYSIVINVTGGGGTHEHNHDLAVQIRRELERSMASIARGEISKARRIGGMSNPIA